MNVLVWVLGLLFATGIGHFIVGKFLERLRKPLRLPKEDRDKEQYGSVSPSVTGVLERMFFSIAVAVNASGFLPAMIAWLAVKLAANWQARSDLDTNTKVNYMFSALIAGLMSMLVAIVAGIFIRNLT
jgi:hypothetical protein